MKLLTAIALSIAILGRANKELCQPTTIQIQQIKNDRQIPDRYHLHAPVRHAQL